MALPETLETPQSSDSSSSSFSSSDPQLKRNLSSSRLNAQAPEFVPTRSTPLQQHQQSLRMMIPPPPPGMMHVYSPPSAPAGVAFHFPVPVPPHLVPVHHHLSMRNHHPHPYQNPNHREEEVETVVKKDQQKEHKDHGATSSKNGLSEETTSKIVNQVEYYFGDLNLATTDHLMRFINKDPEGYVPIYVVASFKKIKALVTTHSQLATVLRNSSKLVVSEDGKKVRRRHPLTESDMKELQSRIIVAENLPEDHCHQNLMKIFSAVGSVTTIRTCQPQPSGGGVSSASRSVKSDGIHFSNKLHAFVEYETVELAEKAVAELNDEGNWRSGLRVHLMLRNASKPVHPRVKKGHDGGQCEEDEVSITEMHSNEKQQEDPSQSHGNHGEEHPNDKDGGQKKGRNRGRYKGRGRTQYHNNHHNSLGNHVSTPPLASGNWVSNEQATVGKQPTGPRMPDGTRGFTMGRGKPVAA